MESFEFLRSDKSEECGIRWDAYGRLEAARSGKLEECEIK